MTDNTERWSDRVGQTSPLAGTPPPARPKPEASKLAELLEGLMDHLKRKLSTDPDAILIEEISREIQDKALGDNPTNLDPAELERTARELTAMAGVNDSEMLNAVAAERAAAMGAFFGAQFPIPPPPAVTALMEAMLSAAFVDGFVTGSLFATRKAARQKEDEQ